MWRISGDLDRGARDALRLGGLFRLRTDAIFSLKAGAGRAVVSMVWYLDSGAVPSSVTGQAAAVILELDGGFLIPSHGTPVRRR